MAPTRMIRAALLGMCLALAALLAPVADVAQAQLPGAEESGEGSTPAPDPFGRDTPRSTVTGLLRILGAQDYAAAERFFALPEGQEDEAAALAVALQSALDAGGSLEPYGELSNDVAGDLNDGLAPELEQVGALGGAEAQPILLQQVQGEDGAAYWQVSAETLRALEPTEADAEAVAAPAEATVAGAPLNDWLTLLGLLLLTFGGFWLVSRVILFLIRRFSSPDSAVYHLSNAALPPLALFLSFVAFRIYGEDAPVSIIARQMVLRYLGILGMVAIVWFALRLVDAITTWLTGRMERAERRQAASVIVFARRVIKVILLALALISVLDTLGFDVTTGLAALGFGGLLLALGAQKSVENLVGTVTVLADRPVQVGDFCRVGEVSGTIEDIGIRSTRIRTNERTVVTIPNGDFSSQKIENFSKRDRYLFQVMFGVEYSLSAQRVRQAISLIEAALAENPRLLHDPRRATLKELAPDSLGIEAFAYIDTPDYPESLAIRQELLLDIYGRLEAAGIPLAFPTRTLYLRSDTAEAETAEAEAG